MRLNSVALQNYVGIYNGMHKHTIHIDFTKCRNSITVIKGDNGSGKSSLFKAIHPFSDPSYFLIDGLEAMKDIVYQLDNGETLEVKYIYPVDDRGNRKSTQCYVYVNGNLMNQNHNVTDGRDIICNILDIDITFLPLTQLSSDDRGLADKTPSQRKNFINKKINELNVYNEIYKKLSKKSTQMKSLVNSISLKIKDIGDIKTLSTNIKLWNTQLGDLEVQKIKLTADLSSMQTKMNMLIGEENPEEVYGKATSELTKLYSKLENYKYDKKMVDTIKREFLKKEVSELETNITALRCNITGERKSIAKCNSKIDDNTIKLNSYGDINLINQYKERISTYDKRKKALENLCKVKGYSTDYQIYDIDTFINISNQIVQSFDNLKTIYNDSNVIERAMEITKAYYNDIVVESKTTEELDEMKQALNNMKLLLNNQNIYRKQSRGIENIPKDCTHKSDCVFVKAMVEAYNSLLSDEDYDKLVKQIDAMSKDISDYTKELRIDKLGFECADDYIQAINNIKNYIPILKKFNAILPEEDIDSFIIMVYRNGDILQWMNIDLTILKEVKNIIIEMNNIDSNLSSLNEKYSSMVTNKDLIEYLSKEIEELKKEKSEHEDEVYNINIKLDELNNKFTNAKDTLDTINHNIEMKDLYERLIKEEIEPKMKQIKEYDSKYKEFKELAKEFNNEKDVLDDLVSNQIPKLTSVINDANFKIRLYNNYVNEYNQYKDEYEKYETIKYYCSPTTGIQTVFMGKYMNDIIDISNNLLSKFFGGSFVLQPFVINEKEFKIPVKGDGILNDDISSMSTSQICMISMIISFALMSRSSSVYNIIKMDEIDGGLDTNNRLAFFNVLSILMNYLNCSQCIMISHNSELNLANMDIVLLKNSDPNIQLDGNIIYNYEEDMSE